MKNIYSASLLFLLSFYCKALAAQQRQEKVIYSQDIEAPFNLSQKDCAKIDCRLEVIPNVFANEARETSRVYAETKSPISGKSSLGMIPLSSFNPEVEVRVSLIAPALIHHVRLEFNSKSLKNGGVTSTKYAELYGAISLDNGKNYSKDSLLGIYLNANGEVKKISIILNGDFKNAQNLYFKWSAVRSKDSSGTAAKVILDDIKFYGSTDPMSVEDWNSKNSNLYIQSMDQDFLMLNITVSGSLHTLLGGEILRVTESNKINIGNLSTGIYILKTIHNQYLKFNIAR